jgi:hypothetical protein
MKIITAVVNNPVFIEIQYYTLKKYVKGEFEFIVFNDAKPFPDFTNNSDITIREQIKRTCEKLNIKCIDVPNQHHKSMMTYSIRAADAMNFMYQYQLQHPDAYLIIDSDMFLIDELDPLRYAKYDAAVCISTRHEGKTRYVWNGLVYMNIGKLKEKHLVNWNLCRDCDTGGMMKEWLEHQDNLYYIQHLWSCCWDKTNLTKELSPTLIEFLEKDPRNKDSKYFCELYDDIFFHYRAGGNWRKEGLEFHNKHTALLKKVLCSD